MISACKISNKGEATTIQPTASATIGKTCEYDSDCSQQKFCLFGIWDKYGAIYTQKCVNNKCTRVKWSDCSIHKQVCTDTCQGARCKSTDSTCESSLNCPGSEDEHCWGSARMSGNCLNGFCVSSGFYDCAKDGKTCKELSVTTKYGSCIATYCAPTPTPPSPSPTVSPTPTSSPTASPTPKPSPTPTPAPKPSPTTSATPTPRPSAS